LTIFVLAVPNFVTAQNWRDDFVTALEKGKAVKLPDNQTKAEGLAYTPPEDVVLEEAIARAIENKAPPCQCMKIAIDFDYNPYSVIKNIYSAGGDIKLDQVCSCATEAGVMKAIIAKAAADAVSPLNEPIFKPNEIAQSQCLGGEEGLAYTQRHKPLYAIRVSSEPESNVTPVGAQ